MEKKLVKELMTKKFVKVFEDEPIYELVGKIIKDRQAKLGCIVDRDNRLKGIITPKELLEMVEIREFGHIKYPFFRGPEALRILASKYARDIMCPPVFVVPEDTIDKAIHIMLDRGFYEVPVVDKNGKMLGIINYFAILSQATRYLENS
jgi:CBS domain-containing protein